MTEDSMHASFTATTIRYYIMCKEPMIFVLCEYGINKLLGGVWA